MLDDDGSFDLNRITPMPQALLVTKDGYSPLVNGKMSVWAEDEVWRDLSQLEVQEVLNTGFDNCNDWAMVNWGTNGFLSQSCLHEEHIDEGYVSITYRSIDLPPTVVLTGLRNSFPTVTFEFSYRTLEDEGCDYPHVIGAGSRQERKLLQLASTWIDDDR